MDLFRYIIRFLFKIRWYLVVLPMIALIVAWFMTRHMERVYDTNTTIYTGMITGYNIEGGVGAAGGNAQTNITNLMLIITTDNTIHEVALRLFARCMMYGNAKSSARSRPAGLRFHQTKRYPKDRRSCFSVRLSPCSYSFSQFQV